MVIPILNFSHLKQILVSKPVNRDTNFTLSFPFLPYLSIIKQFWIFCKPFCFYLDIRSKRSVGILFSQWLTNFCFCKYSCAKNIVCFEVLNLFWENAKAFFNAKAFELFYSSQITLLLFRSQSQYNQAFPGKDLNSLRKQLCRAQNRRWAAPWLSGSIAFPLKRENLCHVLEVNLLCHVILNILAHPSVDRIRFFHIRFQIQFQYVLNDFLCTAWFSNLINTRFQLLVIFFSKYSQFYSDKWQNIAFT